MKHSQWVFKELPSQIGEKVCSSILAVETSGREKIYFDSASEKTRTAGRAKQLKVSGSE